MHLCSYRLVFSSVFLSSSFFCLSRASPLEATDWRPRIEATDWKSEAEKCPASRGRKRRVNPPHAAVLTSLRRWAFSSLGFPIRGLQSVACNPWPPTRGLQSVASDPWPPTDLIRLPLSLPRIKPFQSCQQASHRRFVSEYLRGTAQ